MKQSEFEVYLKDVEGNLEHLKAMYEQYFMGLERVAPERQHEKFQRALRELRRSQPRNTALRFRVNTLVQRHTTLSTHWKRIARQIEEGTYKRDVLRAKKRRAEINAQKERERKPERPSSYELNMDMEVDVDTLFGDAGADLDAALDGLRMPTTPPGAPQSFSRPKGLNAPKVERRTPAAKPRPQASMPPPVPRVARAGPADERMKEIYSSYLDARRQNNERTDNVKFESLQKSVDKMLPKLQQKYKGKKIDFEVVIKNGRVGLKPVTKG